MPDEFDLIASLFAPLSRGFPGAFGLRDDAAVLDVDPLRETVVTVDALVAGVHFLPNDPPEKIAQKLIRVNLSDLAAKGAEPFAVLLSAAFPQDLSEDWVRAFASGLGQDLQAFGVALIGGDTVSTPGPLVLSLTALGKVPAGKTILRSGGVRGDLIWVSGTIGDGALGLAAVQGRLEQEPEAHRQFLAERYRLPQPRTTLGPALIGLASAGMDISDGLVQDLEHLCRCSGLGARINAPQIPLSTAVRALVEKDSTHFITALVGGDDYELLFTAPVEATPGIMAAAYHASVAVTAIGHLEPTPGVVVVDEFGNPLFLKNTGWRHFR